MIINQEESLYNKSGTSRYIRKNNTINTTHLTMINVQVFIQNGSIKIFTSRAPRQIPFSAILQREKKSKLYRFDNTLKNTTRLT